MAELLWCCDGALAGDVNMERDRALWRTCEADPSPGVRLRLYGWSPRALSLGFHQPAAEVDEALLRTSGVQLVRRPTGGAAVLHDDEITYSVTAPLGLPGFGRGVLEIHGAIAAAMRDAFAALGVGVDFGGGGQPREFACFAGAGGHEMTVGGRKLVGSALRRGRRGFLQHGSILRGEGHLELCSFMAGLDDAGRDAERERLRKKTCTLRSMGVELDQAGFGAQFAAALGERVSMPVRRLENGVQHPDA
jgi:hypothetical protein